MIPHLTLPLNTTLPRDWFIHDAPNGGFVLRLELKDRGEVAIVRSHLDRVLPHQPKPDYVAEKRAYDEAVSMGVRALAIAAGVAVGIVIGWFLRGLA